MAEFCKACALNTWGTATVPSDFKGLCKPGEHASVLCEGCGPIWVDHEGARIEPRQCSTCAWWQPGTDGDWGTCRGVPPVVGSGGIAQWPDSRNHDFCRLWAGKGTGLNEFCGSCYLEHPPGGRHCPKPAKLEFSDDFVRELAIRMAQFQLDGGKV